MSSRALRRLQEQQGSRELSITHLLGNNKTEDDESGDDGDSDKGTAEEELSHVNLNSLSKKTKKKARIKHFNNPFELLEQGDGERDDITDEQEELDQKLKSADLPENGSMKSKKNKKKKKKKGKDKENEENLKMPGDEIEASLQEVNRILGDPGTASSQSSNRDEAYSVNMKPLLHIDYRNLNPETELKRMFGAQVIRGEQQQQRNRRHRNHPLHRSSRLVQPKDTWHNTGGIGVSMKYLGENEGFTFEHSPAYQKIQHQFCDAVESGHPELIISILRDHPYHFDTLLQMAEFHRANEDVQTAAESIEKALYGMECVFHPMFNLASGNCHLSYRRPENRTFYLCLFKHILNLGRRGCNRTAFEFCKVLLSIDPVDDPLDCMSMIDYYALRSEQYDHLVRLEAEVLTKESMRRVPNFAMSIPLAHYHIAMRNGTDTTVADLKLQDALLFFPVMLMPLLDQCSVQPDKTVSSHPFFSTSELNDSTSELQRLVMLYVKRCESCWKEAGVMTWLEKNVKAVIEIVNKGTDKRPTEYSNLRQKRFKHPPLSLVRHYFLSEFQGLGVPRQFLGTSVLSHDPYPPANSIISYTRPVRQTVASQDRSGVLRSLIQSLLPTYNPYEPANIALRRQANAVVEGGDEDEGARGGTAIPQQIQQGVQAIMQAMRQLLNEPFAHIQNNANRDENQPELDENEREWEEEEENR
ncbi:ribosome quality control complex subunit TCF25-like [Physella acuta]|uniref:ribosome quality control complex subunit TCF25-like n=1 Tax=Physella acuta TaxID=109671 RepID=UPI0027DB43DF|nr:ribosome quality control complex subunit TCF25-like [Physella acuta]